MNHFMLDQCSNVFDPSKALTKILDILQGKFQSLLTNWLTLKIVTSVAADNTHSEYVWFLREDCKRYSDSDGDVSFKRKAGRL